MREPFPHVPLRDVAHIERGRFSARPRNDPKYYGGDTPFIQTGDVARASREIREWSQTLNDKGLRVSHLFPKGTIFMAIAANVGDVAYASFDAACPDSVVGIRPKVNIEREWLFQMLTFSKANFAALSTQNAQANLSLEKILPFRVPRPTYPEQRKIAAILRTWDEAIEKISSLRKAKDGRLNALRESLLFGSMPKGASHSNGPLQRLGEATRELTKRNAKLVLDRAMVMGVSNARGIVPMREQTVAGDISRYLLLPPLGFAYNPMRINVGSIAINKAAETFLVSPDYVVFACLPDRLDPEYLDHLRRTRWWLHHINAGGSGSVRQRTYYDDLALHPARDRAT